MTAVNGEMAASLAGASVVDLHDYRVATFGRLHGRTLSGEAEDLAKRIDRLLHRVGECLAAVPVERRSTV